ncbi:MAG: glycosyltransferase family 2 protein [Prevotella sp.]|nr:glycosyltransferase family 2 protein [Prevotella sp.]
MISILIPTFNDSCLNLVDALAKQATVMDGLAWEIIVADDASTDKSIVEENLKINEIPHCRYIVREKNVGRSAIRNFLADTAQGDWLLLIDGDGSVIEDDYLRRFVEATQQCSVCYGGYRMMPGPKGNLRWLYERHAAARHTVEQRRKHPFLCFNISNLLIRKELMLAYPLDARFTQYGYEDVLLGKQLQQAGITIHHIDSPIGFFDYEDNAHFVAKTEEGLRTLWQFHEELQGYSTLLYLAEKLNTISRLFYLSVFQLLQNKWRRNLTGSSPSLQLFQLYKLGYLLSLSQPAKDSKD